MKKGVSGVQGGVVKVNYYKSKIKDMIIQLIKYYKYAVQEEGGTYCGRRLEPLLYGGKQGDRIVVAKTVKEVIERLCAHPDSWIAHFGRPIQDFSNEELIDVIKRRI